MRITQASKVLIARSVLSSTLYLFTYSDSSSDDASSDKTVSVSSDAAVSSSSDTVGLTLAAAVSGSSDTVALAAGAAISATLESFI